MTDANDGPAALVPAGINTATYQCLRSLRRRGVHTVVASEDEGRPEFASRYCGERVPVPSPTESLSAYRDALLTLAARNDVRTVVPCREVDAYLLSKHRDRFEEDVSLVVPSFDRLRTVHDRVRLFEAARAADVPMPETRPLSTADDPSAPRVVKSRYNLLTVDYVDDHPRDRPEERKEVTYLPAGEEPDAERLRDQLDHDPVVQSFVPKDGEYVFAGLYDHGEPLVTFQHRQVRGDSYVGGGGVYRESVYEPDLAAVADRLLGHLDWHGLVCAEYVRNAETGEFELVEINPRMWQSLPSTVSAGADVPADYWAHAAGRTDDIDPGYDLGVGSHLLYGEVGYLCSLLRDDSPLVERPSLPAAVGAVVASCLTQPRFDYLHLDDPGPFLQGIRKAVGD